MNPSFQELGVVGKPGAVKRGPQRARRIPTAAAVSPGRISAQRA